MGDYIGASSFMQGFMRGYSFVDDIKYRKRQEQRLEEDRAERKRITALNEARAARAEEQRTNLYNLSLEDRLRQQRHEDEDRAYQQSLRDQAEEDRQKFQEGQRLLELGASDEELAPYSAYNPNVAAYLAGERRLDRLTEAFGTVNSLQGGAIDAAAGAQQQQSQQRIPEPRSYLDPSRGPSGLRSVDVSTQIVDPELGLSDESWLDTQMQRGVGLAGVVGNAATDIVRSVTGTEGAPGPFFMGQPGATLGEVGGNIRVPEGYVTPRELEELSGDERAQALVKNREILEEVKSLGSSDDPQKRLREGSRAMVVKSQEAVEQIGDRYNGFLRGMTGEADDPLFAMANEDPLAFALTYFADRATLRDAWGAKKVAGLDARLQPYMTMAETELSARVLQAPAGSLEQRQQARQLRSIQLTQADMYDDYKLTDAAQIRENMPVGNPRLAGAIQTELENPDRPTPDGMTTSQELRPALTTAQRLTTGTASRSLSRKQIEHLTLLFDNNLLSAQDVTTAVMTGRLPAKTPAVELREFGDHVYAIGPDGFPTYLFTPSKAKGATDYSNVNQLTLEAMENVKAGVKLAWPTATNDFLASLDSVLIQDSDWIEGLSVDLSDPVDQRKIGMMYANAYRLAKRENSWLPNSVEEAPTMSQILQSPAMASRLAMEKDFVWSNILPFGEPFRQGRPQVNVPEGQSQGLNFNINSVRQDIKAFPGSPMWPRTLTQIDPNTGKMVIDSLTNEEVDAVLTRYYSLVEDQEAQR